MPLHSKKAKPRSAPGLLRLRQLPLEVIRNADRRSRDDLISVGIEDVPWQAESRGLHKKTTILRPYIPAWAQLIRHAAAEQSADVRIPLRVEIRRSRVLQRRKDHRARAGLNKRVEVLEVQVENVRSAELHLQGVDATVGPSEDLVILRILLVAVIYFECTPRCKHVAVARQKAHSRACILLHAVSGDLGSKGCRGAYAHVLPALLRITGRRRKHQRAQQQHRLLHSSLDPFKFVRTLSPSRRQCKVKSYGAP